MSGEPTQGATFEAPAATADEKSSQRKLSFRPDIEGLRAVAVLAVLFFHAGVPFLPGGYIGVDVFFVISGFLITGLLIREIQSTQRLSIKNFYIRRIRRILPMSTLVLVATLIIASFAMAITEIRSTVQAARASALFVGNWYFAASSADYFDTSTHTNPVLHFWSLGVEEQFYVIWPLLLVVVLILAKWRKSISRALLIGGSGLVVLCAVSLTWSITQTASEGSLAFYGLHTRLWELGIGGLLAFAIPLMQKLPRWSTEIASAVGLLLIVYAATQFNEQTPFPGSAALVPVIGSALVIGAGISHHRSATLAARLLSVRPMQYVGARSYNLYLWHWPVLVFAALWSAPLTFGAAESSHLSMPFAAAAIAIVVAFALTAVTYRFIEMPLRHASLMKKASFAFPAAVVMVLCVIAVSFVAPRVAAVVTQGDGEKSEAIISQATNVQKGGEAALAGAGACRVDVKVPTSTFLAKWNPSACTFGDPDGSVKLALVGDSHAGMWLAGLDKAGKANGWQVTYMSKAGCPVYAVAEPDNTTVHETCVTWAKAVTDKLEETGPYDAVLMARRDIYQTRRVEDFNDPERAADEQRFVAEAHETFRELSRSTDNIVILQDPPNPGFNLPKCIERTKGDIEACSFDREQGIATEEALARLEKQASQGLPADVTVVFVPLGELTCPSEKEQCSAVVEGNLLVFRDDHHIPEKTSRALGPQLGKLLEQYLSKAGVNL